MYTKQRNESMTAFWRICHFEDGNETVHWTILALRDKNEKENGDDYASFNKVIPCITNYDNKKQFQDAYRNAKFKEFQQDLREIIYCSPWFVSMEGTISTYEVVDDVKFGAVRKDLKYKVWFNEEEVDIHYVCLLFESKGHLI